MREKRSNSSAPVNGLSIQVRFLGGEIFSLFQLVEVTVNFISREQSPDFGDEQWQFGGKLGMRLGSVDKAEEFLSD